jgi:hypothetical protein
MPLHPKSKIKLEDDLKLGSAAKAASLPGMGAGASTIRDLSGGPADVTASGVTSNISDPTPETAPVETPYVTAAEHISKEAVYDPSGRLSGFNLKDSFTGEAATGWVNMPGKGLTLISELQGNLDSGDAAGLGAFGQPNFSQTSSGQTSSTPRPGIVNEEFSVEDQVATFDASAYQIDPSRGFETAATLQLRDALTSAGFDIGAEIDAALEGVPTYEIPTQIMSQSFIQSLSGAQFYRSQFKAGDSVQISEVAQKDVLGKITGYSYVYVNPRTGDALIGADGKPKLAVNGSQLHEQARKTYDAALALSSERITGLREEDINQRKAILSNELAEQSALEARIFKLQGDAELATLTAQLSFNSASALQADRLDADAAAREDNQNFSASVETFKSENAFIMQGLTFEHNESMRAMELAWIHGSPEEAKRARLQTQDIERRQIKMQERELLISTLAILGQHPQLRGAIKALGLFKGMEGGGDFDIDSFFNANLPLNAIPSAQEFNRLSPSAQEAMVNDLAGKFGIKPETIMQTIRSQAPNSSRRLT